MSIGFGKFFVLKKQQIRGKLWSVTNYIRIMVGKDGEDDALKKAAASPEAFLQFKLYGLSHFFCFLQSVSIEDLAFVANPGNCQLASVMPFSIVGDQLE